MTDRVKGFVVTLAQDAREDDIAQVITAISMIRGVVGVEAVKANPLSDQIIEMRAQTKYHQSLFEWMKKEFQT